MTKSIVTAADVRAYFRADEKRMNALPAEAQATVREGARGRLHPQAIKGFNSKRRQDRRYVLGASGKAKAEVKAQRETLAAQGVTVGKRGPLSKEAKAVLAQSKG